MLFQSIEGNFFTAFVKAVVKGLSKGTTLWVRGAAYFL